MNRNLIQIINEIIQGHFFNAMFIFLGVISAGFGLKGFLLPNAFILA